MSSINQKITEDSQQTPSAAAQKGPLSISVTLREQAEELLNKYSRAASIRNEPIRVLDRESFSKLSAQIEGLLASDRTHSLTPIELSELNSELAQARLQLGIFKDKAEKAEFAKRTLEVNLVKHKELLAEEQARRAASTAKNLIQGEDAKKRLSELQKENGKLKVAIASAKRDGNMVEEMSLSEQRSANAAKIVDLTNLLQQANKVESDNRKELKRYHDQLMALTNELNLAKAEAGSKWKKMSFAEVASATGSAGVHLTSKISQSFNAKARAMLAKAKESPPDDVKNRAFWINAALDNCQYAILKPYKMLLGGLLDDLKAIEFASRKPFQPTVDTILSVLLGNTAHLDMKQLEAQLGDIDPSLVKMNPVYRNSGIVTMADYIKAGRDVDMLSNFDVESRASSHSVRFTKSEKGKSPVIVKLGGALAKNPRVVVPTLDAVPKLAEAPDPDAITPGFGGASEPPPPPRRSFYQWVRDGVLLGWGGLKATAQSRSSNRPSVSFTSWLQEKFGVVGGIMAAPFAFVSFLFGSWF